MAIVALVGGLIGLLGALIGWLMVQTCAGALGFNICVSVPVPPSFSIGSADALLGISPTLALVGCLGGLVLAVLRKPMTALLAGVLGLVAFLMCVLYLTRVGNVTAAIQAAMGGASASVRVGVGFGLWMSLIGSLLLTVGGLMQWLGFRKKPAAGAAPAA
jgi:hypothetical protein